MITPSTNKINELLAHILIKVKLLHALSDQRVETRMMRIEEKGKALLGFEIDKMGAKHTKHI